MFWPFALLSVPAAWLGGYLNLPLPFLKPLLGLVLLFSAFRLCFRLSDPAETSPPTLPAAFATGAGIGLLSGLTGTGGGIFLTPLLLLRGWAFTRQAAAVSALFILVNSLAGLGGYMTSGQPLPPFHWSLPAAALIGGALGSHLGSRRIPVRTISLLLAAVLLTAGAKLLFTS